MSELQIFNNAEFGEIRMVEVDGKTFAVGNDIAGALDYARPYEAVTTHCKGAVSYRVIDSLGREQETKVIPPGDIYRLIVKAADQSRNENIRAKAEKFEQWIFDDVIPTIQKHGAYMTPEKIEEALINPDALIKLATIIKEEQQKRAEERQKRLEAEKKLDEQKPMIMFAETCIASNDCLLVREVAKLATKNGIVIGEKRLWQKLRDWGEVSKNNEPYQHAMDASRWELKQGTYNTPYGSDTYRTFKVTPKGQIYIVERLKREAS